MNSLLDRIRNVHYNEANRLIKSICGIVGFFSSEDEKESFVATHEADFHHVCEDRVAYGDWQTPITLAERICKTHAAKFGSPDIVIEPTCGLGAFVFAALKEFKSITEIHALEINPRYVAELKLKLLLEALNHRAPKYPDIYIYNADFFEFDFAPIINRSKSKGWNLAVIGNPPWVTNSRQGKSNSDNIPRKTNVYGLKGIDAITGKSNFDISEFITLELLKLSQYNRGGISFLLKNSVIRNLLIKQRTEQIHIGNIEQGLIDAQSEFDVSVEASCLSAMFRTDPASSCHVNDFYTHEYIRQYGWVGQAFVSDMVNYNRYARFDNVSSYVWRSGIKHDCSSILELTLQDGVYINGLGETVKIEDDMIYPLLKSSDIKHYDEDRIRKYLIVPQRTTSTDTSLLKYTHPLTYEYLTQHESAFANRKSSIYVGKDKFSIFGVGDYSFKPYKVVVSALYKDIEFVLVSKIGDKPIVLDDTCYQLDFDNIEEARIVYDALHSIEIQSLLKSLVFSDAKRVVTKGLLMRLNLSKLCEEKGICVKSQRFDKGIEAQLSLFDTPSE